MTANRQRLAGAAWSLLGAAAGLAVAIIVTLNVHIWAGLEEGYAATPSEVFDASVVLGVVDVLLVVILPVAGAVAVHRLRRRHLGSDDDHHAP